MKILQVWNGNELGDNYRKCMMSVNTICMTNSLEHIIVCKNKDLFTSFGNTSLIDYDQYIIGKDMKWWEAIIENYQTQADFVRLDFGQSDPEIFYIDADVELYRLPVFINDGRPYFGMLGRQIDFFMMYVNGNTQFFIDLMAKFQGSFTPSYVLQFIKYFSIYYRVGGNNIKKVNIIPSDTYKRNWFKQ